jgi:hypothetical protein
MTGCQEQALDPVESGQAPPEIEALSKDHLDGIQNCTHRSLEELLAAQGTTSIPNPNLPDGRWYYPYPNTFGWVDGDLENMALADYTGILNKWMMEQGHPGFGTQVIGYVKEKVLEDGRAEIFVKLHVKNAITWVIGDWANSRQFGPKVFGNTPLDVMGGAQHALCHLKFTAHFINSAPDAPLPDIFQVGFFPQAGQEMISVSLYAQGKGPLADGSPGLMLVKIDGWINQPGNIITVKEIQKTP